MIGGPFRSLGRLSTVLGALWAGLVVAEAVYLLALFGTTGGAWLVHASTACLILYLASFAVFVVWVYRAMSNARALGAEGVKTPIWTVGSYFIPILNLIAPYITMQQIWRASRDAPDWNMQAPSWFVRLWWAVWLAASGTGFALTIAAMNRAPPWLSAAFAIGEMLRGVVTLMLVLRVSRMQDADVSFS